MASGSDRQASSPLGPLTPAPPAALLADLQAALSTGMPAAAAAALTQPLQDAIAAPGSVDPAALARAFEQIEDALEVVLFFPPSTTPPA